MNKSLRKKLCWNCEGSVSLAEEICPFCGVSVVPAFLEGVGANFAPPYSAPLESDEIPKSPYHTHEEDCLATDTAVTKEESDEESAMDEFKQVVIAVALLLSGSVFFLFGLALALFSQNGIFTLHWNGDMWFVYAILAFPLLFVGWKSLMKLD